MPQAIREGIFTILFISGPLVILAAGLGLTIGIIQAATQVQEQTLGSAVKIIGLFVALIISGFYMFQYLSKYATENVERAFKLVPTLGAKALPRRNFLDVPVDGSNQTINTAELIDHEPHESQAKSKMAGGLDEPDFTTKNENFKEEALLPPQSARRENKDIEAIKKQDLTIKNAERLEASAPVASAPTRQPQLSLQAELSKPEPAKPTVSKPPPVQASKPVTQSPRPSTPRVEEEPKAAPKRLRGTGISDRLNKIKQEAGT